MTYDNPPIITSTMRRYNPQTGHYESVVTDPWAGAPKGIRAVEGHLSGVLHVLTENLFYTRFHGAAWRDDSGWNEGVTVGDLQTNITLAQEAGWSFPDFDGAPEGQRFYVSWSVGGWQPNVDTGDGVHSLIRGKWWKQSGVYGVKWFHANNAQVILVDPAPEEPKPIPSEIYYYYDLVGRGNKLNAEEVRSAHLVIAVNDEGKVRVEKSRHFAQSLT